MRAASGVKGDAGHRAAAAEMAGDVFDREVVESQAPTEPEVEGVTRRRPRRLPAAPRPPRPARRRSVRARRRAAGGAPRIEPRPAACRTRARRSASTIAALLERGELAKQRVPAFDELALAVVALRPPAERQPARRPGSRPPRRRAPRSAASGCAPADSSTAPSALRLQAAPGRSPARTACRRPTSLRRPLKTAATTSRRCRPSACRRSAAPSRPATSARS